MTKKHAAVSAQQDRSLDSVFSALADPVRRTILERLQKGPLLVSELAEPFEISVQAVSRHIQVLEDAGLVVKERTGRVRRCMLDVGPIFHVVGWLSRYSRYGQAQVKQPSSKRDTTRAKPRASSRPARAAKTARKKR